MHLALVELDAAGVADGVDDVLRGDRAEQAPVLAGLVGDGEDRLVEQRRALGGLVGRFGEGLVGDDLALAGGLDQALGGGLGELARDEEVAQVALGDVDYLAARPQGLDVLEEDGLGQRGS